MAQAVRLKSDWSSLWCTACFAVSLCFYEGNGPACIKLDMSCSMPWLGHGTLNQCGEAVRRKCWMWPVADEASIACLVSSAGPSLHMITGQCVHRWLAGPHCHAHPMQDAGHRASRTCFVAWPVQDITNKTEIIHHKVLHHTTSSQYI